ncbi:hypothetical protein QP735_04170 [Curtobacterium citreum]|uniref:hypothetical protein n=1 Tax=Curtobacterium citreum TaxID=2036 RepID=UPI0025512FA3|nr:hypothetical protein [Curtobacterium citreum]MDK8171719.1 hypothetical protein [Curtobacterium citreum]
MTADLPEQFAALKAAAQMTDAEAARFAIETTAHYQQKDGEGSMNAPTPEQMRALATRITSRHGPAFIDVDEAAATLRAAADQLEAVPTRKQIDTAVGAVLFNASNYPRPAMPHILGQDIAPLRAKVTDAVLALLNGAAND